jgi:flagellar basal body-associated protein FliL
MSEETNVPESDGTWSGLKKTIIGTVSTAVLAGGTWVTTTLFNGGEDKEETKTEQAAPAQPVINVNLENNNTNQQKQSSGGGTNTIIKERVIEKQAAPQSQPTSETVKPAKKEEESW